MKNNDRLYKIVNGKRTRLANADADLPQSNAWSTRQITRTGDQITCYWEGKSVLEIRDTSFPDSGRIGVWSKADTGSHFDDLTLEAD